MKHPPAPQTKAGEALTSLSRRAKDTRKNEEKKKTLRKGSQENRQE